MENKVCSTCGARFLEDQHYWSTGALGNKEDLAGLVCDKYGNDECINPFRGTNHSGETWESRLEFIEKWGPENPKG